MKKTLPLILAVALVSMAAAGGAVWYLGQKKEPAAVDEQAAQEKPAADPKKYKYVSVEKVIVMLRAEQGEQADPGTPANPARHYLATDLVFKSPLDQEKTVKEQVPLLRSIAVRALSSYSFEK